MQFQLKACKDVVILDFRELFSLVTKLNKGDVFGFILFLNME